MKQARRHAEDERPPAAHDVAPPRRSLRWLPAAAVAVAALVAVCIQDAVAWLGRPFAGFLFLDNRIVVSIGRASWRREALRPVEWATIVSVDGRPAGTAEAVHAAVAAAPVGRVVEYGFRRGIDTFGIAVPVTPFTGEDFVAVFLPMLAVGGWMLAMAVALVVRRPALPEIRATALVCLTLGLILLTGPDQYGPYRFPWLFYLGLAGITPALLQLTAAVLVPPERWPQRIVAAAWVVFGAAGTALVVRRDDASLFLPLLYLLYCGIANALLLYVGSLATALIMRRRPRRRTALALGAVLVAASVAIGVNVAYPLLVQPISAAVLILPMAVWPLATAVAFADGRPPADEERP
jgi:hypothetical protein